MFERSGALIERKFFEYLPPSLFTMASLMIAAVLNTVIIGNFLGESALAAAGLTTPLLYMVNAFYYLFTYGSVTAASIALGRREADCACRIFSLGYVLGMLVMLSLALGSLLLLTPLTTLFTQGKTELAGVTRDYIVPLVCKGPALFVVLYAAQFVRIDGRPWISARISVAMNFSSIICMYVVLKFFGAGISGAIWASVAGYVVGVFMLIPYFTSKERTFFFEMPGIRDMLLAVDIIKIGMPRALSQGFVFLYILIFNMLLLRYYGSSGLASMAICMNALPIALIFINASNDSLLPIVGVLFGERDNRGIRYALRITIRTMLILCAALTTIFELFPAEVSRAYGIVTDAGLASSVPALRIFALCLPFYGFNQVMMSYFQTTGRKNLAIMITALDSLICIVIYAAILAPLGNNRIWYSYLLSSVTTIALTFLVSAVIKKRENAEWITLLKRADDESTSWDITIPATEAAAVGLSEQVIDFCISKGSGEIEANRIGIAVEEMASNIAVHGYGRAEHSIDVLVRCIKDDIVVRIRDNGVPFDPTGYRAEGHRDSAAAETACKIESNPKDNSPIMGGALKQKYDVGGIEVVRRIASEITYSHQLGFNSTVITVKRGSREESR